MTRRMVTTNEMMVLLKSNVIALFAIFFVVSLAKIGDGLSRTIILVYFLFNMFNPLWAYWIKKRVIRYGWMRKPVFVIGDTEGIENIQKWFAPDNPFGYDIAAVINVEKGSRKGVRYWE